MRIPPAVAAVLAVALLPWAAAAERRGDAGRGFALSEPCALCHEADGRAAGYRLYPRIAGQHYDYLVTALKEFRGKERRQTMAPQLMWDAAARLTDQEIHDLAAFYSALPW